MPTIADSTLGWTVGYLLVLAFLLLTVVPYLVGRRLGGRAAAGLAVGWSILGVGLTLALGDLEASDAVVAGILAFGVPWGIAAAIGTRSHERDRAGGGSLGSGRPR